MNNARPQHPNAALTPRGRLKMVRLVIVDGWTIEAAADKFQVDAKTVTKWRHRFLAEGEAGLFDRSSRPKNSPNETPPECRRRVIELRNQRRWGAAHIGFEVGRAGSTVQNILVAEGIGCLDSGDRATADPIIRYQRDRPGELVHVDVKKLAGIPDGGGWRIHGRGQAPTVKRSATGYRFLHTALDDRTRIVYSEIHANEQPSPPSASGNEPTPTSTSSASTSNECSPTTARATGQGSGATPLRGSRPHRNSRALTGHRPTARSNAPTGSCSRNGPTYATGTPTANAQTTSNTSSISTITIEHTAPSDGQHQSQRSRTTSPVITTSARAKRIPAASDSAGREDAASDTTMVTGTTSGQTRMTVSAPPSAR